MTVTLTPRDEHNRMLVANMHRARYTLYPRGDRCRYSGAGCGGEAEAVRKLGDAYHRKRRTPRLKRMVGAWFALQR